ncbi:MAG: 2-succinyl-6-hydroxy-2,4-cyclohexadiene-1-carboxylate synthase [Dehalococcoidia bacterium]|nr:2-succinyl-6-hydroxy-2,4-cyclohexadiene-1-carboxylate synthase [Dehalococcoidia bacterium]
MSRVVLGDIALNVEVAGSGRPLLLLHGFTGSAAAWVQVSPTLSRRARTIAVDLIGHGASDCPGESARYSMDRCVADLVALLDHLGVECADVLGYSMGGRVALQLAAAAPQRVAALVVESASPGLRSEGERRERVAADNDLAIFVEREGIEAFVDRWERLPLFHSQQSMPPAARAGLRAQRLANNPTGLANSLRGMGAGQQGPLWERLTTLSVPTLMIVGESDVKYREIASSMAALMPAARLEMVAGAGHTVHFEQPQAFTRLVLDFLGPEERPRHLSGDAGSPASATRSRG